MTNGSAWFQSNEEVSGRFEAAVRRGLTFVSDSDLQQLLLAAGKEVVRAGTQHDALLPLWFSAWDVLEEESERRSREVRELEKLYFAPATQ